MRVILWAMGVVAHRMGYVVSGKRDVSGGRGEVVMR